MNVQFVVKDGEVYLIEVNLCVLWIVLFVVKVIDSVIVLIVVCLMVGELLLNFLMCFDYVKVEDLMQVMLLGDLFILVDLIILWFSVKEVVMLFVCFFGVDMIFGLEMCLIGEVMGWVCLFVCVFLKVQLGVGIYLLIEGKVFILICDVDKIDDMFEVGCLLCELGFGIFVICGIVVWYVENGVEVEQVNKVYEGGCIIIDLLKDGEVVLLFNIIEGV